jgi:hypothetical protein
MKHNDQDYSVTGHNPLPPTETSAQEIGRVMDFLAEAAITEDEQVQRHPLPDQQLAQAERVRKLLLDAIDAHEQLAAAVVIVRPLSKNLQ